MKTKYTILLIVSAIITLSFTFSTMNVSKKESKEVAVESKTVNNEPAGGLGSEDKF